MTGDAMAVVRWSRIVHRVVLDDMVGSALTAFVADSHLVYCADQTASREGQKKGLFYSDTPQDLFSWWIFMYPIFFPVASPC